MTEEKKKPYFNIAMGYVGVLLIFIAEVRYILIIHDEIGRSLSTLGVLCIYSYFRAAESKWGLTRKETYIFRGSFITGGIIIAFVSFCFI
jgi:hypothetical protein